MNQPSFVGVDTHKDSLACYVNGQFKQFPTTLKGFKEAVNWTKGTKWAIEGAYCFGRPLAAYLIKNGHEVYEVNPLLTKSWRQTISLNGKKNDYGDAKVISLFAHTQPLVPVSLQTVQLKEKLTARKLLVKQRTQITNNIKMLFASRGKELPYKDIKTIKAGKWLLNQDDKIIQYFAKILVSLNETIKELEKQIEKELPEKARELTQLKGIKTITAATIYAETKGRLISSAALASYCGIAPVEYGSGKKTKHKNNKAGNRILNSIFFKLSSVQSRYDEKGKEYFDKKLKEGKSRRHARKCVARRLVNIVFNILTK
jgi:transposase